MTSTIPSPARTPADRRRELARKLSEHLTPTELAAVARELRYLAGELVGVVYNRTDPPPPMSTAELDELGARLLRSTIELAAAAFVGLDDPDTEPDRGAVFPWPGNGGAL